MLLSDALTLTRTAGPSSEPLTTAEAKAHLRVTDSSEDTYIDSLVAAARQHVEEVTRRALLTQTWEFSLDAFPLAPLIRTQWGAFAHVRQVPIIIPRPPLQSVTQIEYVDVDGTTQTLSASRYRVDSKSEPGRLTAALDQYWPTVAPVTNAVTITYDAGVANAADIPDAIKHAIKLLVSHWYEHREAVDVGARHVTRVPEAADALLAPYRIWT